MQAVGVGQAIFAPHMWKGALKAGNCGAITTKLSSLKYRMYIFAAK